MYAKKANVHVCIKVWKTIHQHVSTFHVWVVQVLVIVFLSSSIFSFCYNPPILRVEPHTMPINAEDDFCLNIWLRESEMKFLSCVYLGICQLSRKRQSLIRGEEPSLCFEDLTVTSTQGQLTAGRQATWRNPELGKTKELSFRDPAISQRAPTAEGSPTEALSAISQHRVTAFKPSVLSVTHCVSSHF